MMTSARDFWNDESGAVLSAEIVTVGTVAVLGTTVGLHSVATALNGELTDMAQAIRSFDQSYSFRGFTSCRASTPGSCFTQESLAASLQSLCAGGPPVAPAPAVTQEDAPVPAVVTPIPGQITPAEEKLSPPPTL